jgi:pimeloyl-ACP methyl ester carboxylesterase
MKHMTLSKIFPSILIASAGLVGLVAGLVTTAAQAQEGGSEVHRDVAATFEASFWKTFHHGSVLANGVRLHYVEGGGGAPVLLIPGWPESWYTWRLVMSALVASGRRVVAIDPRGFGDSDRPQNGYDLKTIASDMHSFVEALGLAKTGQLDVVGHDVGVWIGYAYATDWPGDIRRLALFEAALPGVSPPAPAGIPSTAVNLRTWQFAFNRLDDLPEILIQGHEREFLIWLFREKSIKAWENRACRPE